MAVELAGDVPHPAAIGFYDRRILGETAPALWLVIATGAASGLLASLVGYALLGLPLVQVRVRHELHIDAASQPTVVSYASVTNLRGRMVTIDEVFLLKRRSIRGTGSGRPAGWEFPASLAEGQSVKCYFERRDYPNALAFAIDSAGRVWPRRRWLRVKWRAVTAVGMIGWPWQLDGPTDRQIERAVERTQGSNR